MKLSPFSKPTIDPPERWLTNKKAAKILGFNMRTIKRWMNDPAKREALGAVRHGKQWRILLPKSFGGNSEWAWEMQTDHRLKEIGVHLKNSWEKDFEELGKQSARYHLETYRLWLAAYIKALGHGRVTQKIRVNILLLWQTACRILDLQKSLKRYEMDVEDFKSLFPPQLRERGLSVKSIMQYWPKKNHFKIFHKIHTKSDFEKMRRKLDFWQAYRDELRRRRGKEPTAENLCPLLHKDLMTHINDTRHQIPLDTVKAHTPEELRRAVEADYWRNQNRIQSEINKCFFAAENTDETKQINALHSLPVIDLREPQNGISLRTFRTRYPRQYQKRIIAEVLHILSAPPSVDEKPHTGKTPVRDSKLSDGLAD